MTEPLKPFLYEPFSDNKIVNDLIWALGSSSILDNKIERNFELSPQKRLTAMAKKARWLFAHKPDYKKKYCERVNLNLPSKLGYYFERLIQEWLMIDDNIELLEYNLVVSEKKVTLGEIDLLLVDNISHEDFHWECAVKFYLYHEESSLYYGPGSIDRLDLKINKIFDKQLLLSSNSAFIVSNPSYSERKFTPQCFIKGRLFYHISMRVPAPAECHGLSENHLKGLWLFEEELADYASSLLGRWVIVPPLYWISDSYDIWHELPPIEKDVMIKSLSSHFAVVHKPVFIAYYEHSENHGWQLGNHIFVVHKDWPNKVT